MSSEDGDILALLSELNPTEEQLEASESDDILPAILEAIKSNEKAVEVSTEESAWADSCFVQTSELSDDNWGSMRSALVDALGKPTDVFCDTSEASDDQGINSILDEKIHSLHVEEVSQHDDAHMEQTDNSEDDRDSSIQACEVADVIRGADEHGKQMVTYAAKPEDGHELASFEVLDQTETSDEIFKVWDLELSLSDDDSELELIKDLKKLLVNEAVKPLDQIIDELVVGLSDLSINQTNE